MHLIILFIWLLSFEAIAAKQNETDPNLVQALPYGQRIEMSSTFLPKKQLVDVYLPKDFELDSSHVEYPVIVTLDGWTLSQAVSGVSGHLMNTAALPKSIVVALHTNVWSMLPPLYVHSTDNWIADDKDGFVSAFKNNQSNAANAFWSFLENELFPLLEKNYRASDFRTLIGMSPTSILSLHTMLNKPDLFDAYVLIAATDVLGLGYDEQADFIDEIISASDAGKLEGKYLYVASAEFEARREPRHYQNVQKLIEGLAATKTKPTFEIEHIDHFGHYPVAIPALLNAFDLIFPRSEFQKYQQFLQAGGDVVNAIESHYHSMSKKYDSTIHLQTDLQRNPNSLRSLGYRLLRNGDHEQAEKAFRKWAEISDKNPSAFYWLARTSASIGDYEIAIKHLEKALSLSNKYTPETTSSLQATLEGYRAKLN